MRSIVLSSTAAQAVPQGLLAKLALIEDLDLTRAQARMSADFPGSEAQFQAISIEVKRFLALAVLERNPGHRIVIGEKIDGLWHYFILHTKEYQEFCKQVFGTYLHHVPILQEEKASLAADYQKTRELYRNYFGDPPAALWGDNDMICWGGCDEIRDDNLQVH